MAKRLFLEEAQCGQRRPLAEARGFFTSLRSSTITEGAPFDKPKAHPLKPKAHLHGAPSMAEVFGS